MKYSDEKIVEIGDKVSLSNKYFGLVVAILNENLYTNSVLRVEWDYLKNGILVDFPEIGIIHYDSEIEEDLILVERRAE